MVVFMEGGFEMESLKDLKAAEAWKRIKKLLQRYSVKED